MDKVEGHQGLYKDEETGVIINRSNSERDRYRISKEQSLKNIKSQDDINEMKKELSEMKHLLKQFLRK